MIPIAHKTSTHYTYYHHSTHTLYHARDPHYIASLNTPQLLKQCPIDTPTPKHPHLQGCLGVGVSMGHCFSSCGVLREAYMDYSHTNPQTAHESPFPKLPIVMNPIAYQYPLHFILVSIILEYPLIIFTSIIHLKVIELEVHRRWTYTGITLFFFLSFFLPPIILKLTLIIFTSIIHLRVIGTSKSTSGGLTRG